MNVREKLDRLAELNSEIEAKPKVHKGRTVFSGEVFSFDTERMEVIEDV